jgi:hypothetical protein
MHIKTHKDLRSRIFSLGYTNSEVAAAIGMSAQTLSDKLTYKSRFTSLEMAAIGKLLKLSPEEYYTFFIKPIESYTELHCSN